MMRTKAPSTYGIKTLLYGTVLPAPLIVPSAPHLFQRAYGDGHDCGVHAWDHVYVQDELSSITKSEFLSLFEKSAEMFERLSGKKPLCCAAPGWQTSSVSLEVQQELGLGYSSDTRGRSPFIPVFEGKSYSPMQIPTTLPTMDEILGLPGIDDDSIGNVWLEGMNNEWNVLTVHAEMEGLSKIGVFERFILKAKENGTEFYTLADFAKNSTPAEFNIRIGTITGRAGTLAIQEDK